MELILKSLVPLTFVIFIGWLAGTCKIVDNKLRDVFATYVMSFSFPCLLFIKMATSKPEDLINYRFIIGFTLGLMGMYALTFLSNRYFHRRTLSESCQNSFVCSFPDMVFMGIPIFMVIFGGSSLISIVIGNIVTSLIMIPLTVAILEIAQPNAVKTNILKLILPIFKKPLVLAPIFGMLFSFASVKIPDLAIESFKLIGSTTSGVSLFALGLIMSADKVVLSKTVLLNICRKNLLQPMLMWGIIVVLGITGNWAKEAILLCAMPPAIMTTMFAVKYDVLKVESSSSAIFGTVVALFTMAIIMHLMGIGST